MKVYLQLVPRPRWQILIKKSWERRSVIWLTGVRRSGKTSLVKSLKECAYFDCELPSVRRLLQDPEQFLKALPSGSQAALDEIHLLENPSQLLKIAADHFPQVKLVATGSSSMGASRKFKDTLTGRKEDIWLTPMLLEDGDAFDQPDLLHRLHRGGLPPMFLSPALVEKDYHSWWDDFWSKDIQELFRLERRFSFRKFSELVFSQSGGIFDASSFASPCGVSHTTIGNYLDILEETFVAHIVRPFNTHKASEIIAAPKVYAFDTGFVCVHRGWHSLRPEDLGSLWEHFVLNEIQGQLQTRHVQYWRDKRGHEVDFVMARPGENPIAIECKWSAEGFDPTNFEAFRNQYPKGQNLVVSQDVSRAYERSNGRLNWRFVSLSGLIETLASKKSILK